MKYLTNKPTFYFIQKMSMATIKIKLIHQKSHKNYLMKVLKKKKQMQPYLNSKSLNLI